MTILIPMAGAGKRFSDKGYKLHKPVIPTFSRTLGQTVPMVVAATADLPYAKNNDTQIIYVDRDFHKTDGIEDAIKEYYPNCRFITVDHLTEGQACTCLLAKEDIGNDESLLIAGCDNGMVYDLAKFEQLNSECDSLVFTYRHNETVLANPNAYGWVIADETGKVSDISVKKPISDNPINDHAVVATFWLKHGHDFVRCAEQMIAANDRINNEFYADQVVKYLVKAGLDVRVFEIDRYLGWGTPAEYENYMKTYEYWKSFSEADPLIRGDWQ